MLRERASSPARTLSGGEQSLVALARGMVRNGRLVLLDEPTEGLSPVAVERLNELIRTLQRAGTTILLVEQQIGFAPALAQRVYLMVSGEIAEEVFPEQLKSAVELQRKDLGV